MKCCSHEAHELLRASGIAFRACVDFTFRSWAVNEAGHDELYQFGTCRRAGCRSTIGIPVRMLAEGNRFEVAGRAAKVGKILALVPVGTTRGELDALADTLVTFTREDRARFAREAGCAAAPSDSTWAEVVAGARCRLTANEIFERAAAGGRS